MKTFSIRKHHSWSQLGTQVPVAALAALWIATITGFGQGASREPLTPLRIQWQTNFGGVAIEGGSMKVLGLRSGQYVMGGDSYSPVGANKTAPKRSVRESDAWVVKFDEQGRKLWDVSLGGTNLTQLHAMAERPDGNLLVGMRSLDGISGNRTIPNLSTNALASDFWLVLLDPNGQKIWERAYPGSVDALTALPDGGFVFVYGPWIVRADSEGGVLWHRIIQLEFGAGFSSIALLPNGGIACAGLTGIRDPFGSDAIVDAALLARYDKDGNALWHQTYATYPVGRRFVKVLSANDGGFMLGLTSRESGRSLFDVIKVDQGGRLLWDYQYGDNCGLGGDQLQDMIETRDGGFLLFGHSQQKTVCGGARTGVNWGLVAYWLVRIDSEGHELWDESYGGSFIDAGFTLAEAADGSYLIAGSSQSPKGGVKTMDNFGERQHSSSGDYYPEDFWVLKISSDIYPATSDRVELATAPALLRNPDTSQGPQPAFLDRGLIRLSLIGISNRVHVVEASTNLVDWFGVSTNRLSSYGTIVADRTATNQTRRFYRARALDP